MDEFKQHANVIRHLICPYCKNPADFYYDSKKIYNGRDFGPVYVCWPCDAYTGCRKGTFIPSSRLANAELRLWRKKFHALFDPKWQTPRRYLLDEIGTDARSKAYSRLARLMKMPLQQCHSGSFSVERLKKAVEILEFGIYDDPNRA
jgi:hypothetical protein